MANHGTEEAVDLSVLNDFVPLFYTTFDCYSQGLGSSRNHPEYVIQFQWKGECMDGWIIIADIKASAFVRVCYCVDGRGQEEVDLSLIENNRLIDTNDEGDRWEGDILDGKPFGFGTYYDTNGDAIYTGFYAFSQYVCAGTMLYPIGVIEYQGGFYNGKRYGNGTLYDRNGCVCYSGIWINDAQPSAAIRLDSTFFLHNHVEDIVVSNYCCNDVKTLIFTEFNALHSIHIGNDCFRSVDEFHLEGLPLLTDFIAGDRCFSEVSIDMERRKNPRRSFWIRQCPQLRTIGLGCFAFSDYSSFSVESECFRERL